MKCGLLGKTLKHSYSKIIHNLLFSYEYNLYEREENEVKDFIFSDIDAFNVTIPYKQTVMPYLDEIDKDALSIGAVNTVVKKGGKTYGYNTDFYGLKYLILSSKVEVKGKTAMILGNGATKKTAEKVLTSLGVKEILTVSRTGDINYQNCYQYSVDIIVNTTPVGTYPNSYSSPIKLEKFNNLSLVVDVIYNPLTTDLVYQAKKRNIPAVNGLKMLVAQAKYAGELFLGKTINPTDYDEEIETVTKKVARLTENIVLVGMPGCGKTTIGKILAEKLNKEFVDTDELVVKLAGQTIPEIFAEQGEEKFREYEKEAVLIAGNFRNAVISTGGGVVKNIENKKPLSLNGKIVYIKRELSQLSIGGRPLSKNREELEKLYNERKDKYCDFVFAFVFNDKTPSDTAMEIIKICEY
jgi:shikimate dehydrogenase